MAAIKAILGWLGRKGIVFIVLVGAMILYAVWTSGDVRTRIVREPGLHLDQAASLDTIAMELTRFRQEREKDLVAAGEQARAAGSASLEAEIARSQAERRRLEEEKHRARPALLNALTLDSDAILADRKRDLELAYLDRKIDGLRQALAAMRDRDGVMQGISEAARRAGVDIAGGEEAWRVRLHQAETACTAARERIALFDRQGWLMWHWKQDVQGQRDQLVAESRQACDALAQRRRDHAEWRRLRTQAQEAHARTADWFASDLPLAIDDIRERAEEERQNASRTIAAKAKRFWARYHVDAILKYAAVAFIGILLTPFLIRLFCYYILAPVAMRRRAIRIDMPGDGAGALIPEAPASTTSVGIRLDAGEELLVRQDYLQTTSHVGEKGTQWFLDWRHPVTSIATGLTFLTRIRGEKEITTVSAVRDAFAEVTVLTLPEGGSCVLKPRAIAALVQPMGRPLRVTGHWRLFSLNAWLTMQLRYLVFHGPARLVIKGGRGIRVERAERGRIFGQDQLVGFSADLAYSVTRAETFWPYFLGREQLLKDRVEAGEGILIVEEAPMAGRRPGEVRHGMEGLIDAGMKVFGM